VGWGAEELVARQEGNAHRSVMRSGFLGRGGRLWVGGAFKSNEPTVWGGDQGVGGGGGKMHRGTCGRGSSTWSTQTAWGVDRETTPVPGAVLFRGGGAGGCDSERLLVCGK